MKDNNMCHHDCLMTKLALIQFDNRIVCLQKFTYCFLNKCDIL